ncbi:hypothetical protein NW754_004918 [Fusarium falciforme]|nr:hypothetical protein NW754_004918 [Fusarium falciforme]
MSNPNVYLLAADNDPALLPLLREKPALAASQDEHGYSLVHAAASYNHLNLLRALIREFNVDVDLKDEDNETALFVVETVAAAKILVEAGANKKIESEGDFPIVAEYLARIEAKQANDTASTAAAVLPEAIPPPPEGMKVTVGTMDESQDIPEDVDPEFRRRIEELAGRDDFNTPRGQAELRKLVEDAILGEGIGDERNVRSKQG